MDESGIEPETSPMLRERATDYATRPDIYWMGGIKEIRNTIRLIKFKYWKEGN